MMSSLLNQTRGIVHLKADHPNTPTPQADEHAPSEYPPMLEYWGTLMEVWASRRVSSDVSSHVALSCHCTVKNRKSRRPKLLEETLAGTPIVSESRN